MFWKKSDLTSSQGVLWLKFCILLFSPDCSSLPHLHLYRFMDEDWEPLFLMKGTKLTLQVGQNGLYVCPILFFRVWLCSFCIIHTSLPSVFNASQSVFSLYLSPTVPLFSLSFFLSPSVILVFFFCQSRCQCGALPDMLWVCVCVCGHQNRLHLKESHFVFKPWGDVCPSTSGEKCKPAIRPELTDKPKAGIYINNW